MTDYEKLIARINARSNPQGLQLEKAFLNEMQTVNYGSVENYIRLAMHGVDPAYTAKIREAGDKVKDHLKTVLKEKEEVSYKYQGSVETNTHIVASSDIDLLVISEEFWTPAHSEIKQILVDFQKKQKFSQPKVVLLESAITPPFFQGSSKEVLRQNRLISEKKLTSVYKFCNIGKPKAIQITNQSLKKEVDIVIASWFDNADSITNDKKLEYRGIQIYNKDTNRSEDADFTFLKIKLINDRSATTNGRLKKMIRFLKNVKAEINQDVEFIKSHKGFQFNAICYNIPLANYENKNIFELVEVVYLELKKLYDDKIYRDALRSVDDSEDIYKNKPDSTHELKLLMGAILPILMDLKKQNVL